MTALAHLSGAAELLCELLGLDLVQRQPRDVVGFEVGDVLPRQCVCVCVCGCVGAWVSLFTYAYKYTSLPRPLFRHICVQVHEPAASTV